MITTFYKDIKPSVADNEIKIDAVLEQINTGANNHYEYLLHINMNISKDSNIIVYPYIEGLSNISFAEKEDNDYYIPSVVGSDFTESIAINQLRKDNIIENSNNISLTGFWIPNKAGKYKSRIYLDKLDNFKEVKNPILICVYSENKYGKGVTWTKIVPIKVK